MYVYNSFADAEMHCYDLDVASGYRQQEVRMTQSIYSSFYGPFDLCDPPPGGAL